MQRARVPKIRYREVAATLATEIADGRWPVGDTLPGEIELAERFSVSRFTMREALRSLAETGLLHRRRGSGTVVKARVPPRRFVQPLSSADDLLQYAKSIRLVPTEVTRIVADAALAETLAVRPGSRWFQMVGLRFESGSEVPICHNVVYVDGNLIGADALLRAPGEEAVYEVLERRYGLRVTRIEQRIAAVALTAAEAHALGAAPGVPALRTERRYYTAGGALMQFAISIHLGDRFSYAMSFDRN